MRSCAALISSSAVAMSSALLVPGAAGGGAVFPPGGGGFAAVASSICRDDRPDLFAVDDAGDVALGELEDVDGEAVVHAERHGRRGPHLQPPPHRLATRGPRQEGGGPG